MKSPKLSWSENKSIAGSIGVFVGGWILSALIMFVYVQAGVFAAPFSSYLMPLTWIALGTTAIESLPFKDVDNITATSRRGRDGTDAGGVVGEVDQVPLAVFENLEAEFVPPVVRGHESVQGFDAALVAFVVAGGTQGQRVNCWGGCSLSLFSFTSGTYMD